MCPANNEAQPPPRFTLRKEQVDARQIDPRLRNLVLRVEEERRLDPVQAVAADGGIWVDVIAKINEPGEVPDQLEDWSRAGQIVTGRVLATHVRDLREHVASLKGNRPVRPALSQSVWDVRADTERLQMVFPNRRLDGRDVIIGVVDFDCDFCHPNFRDSDDESRLLYLWDQRERGNIESHPAEFRYGIEYSKEQIDKALRADNPYKELGYEVKKECAHGTHVLDIAAGNGRAPGCSPGVAPNADLIFVHLGKPDYESEESMGDSKRLIEAVRYIFDKADELEKTEERKRPVVVNLSLATNGGPHDGSTLVEQDFDYFLEEKDGRAIVIAAGNMYEPEIDDWPIHSSGQVTADEPAEIEWEITPCACMNARNCPVEREIEIWYSREDQFEVTVVTPQGEGLEPPIALDETATLTFALDNNEVEIGRIVHRSDDPDNHDNHIDIFLDYREDVDMWGTWKIKLRAAGPDSIAKGGVYHAWIERDDCYTSRISERHADRTYTLGSIANGKLTIVVGSYVPRGNRTISDFSSSGPTRDGRKKPELCAPGDGIKAARALTETWRPDSGTSMAAPHVTGLIALMMQAAMEAEQVPDEDKSLGIHKIREILQSTARKNPPDDPDDPEYYDYRYGAGRVDGVAAIARLLNREIPLVPSAAVSAPSPPEPAVPSLELGAMIQELADIAASEGVRLRVTFEVEPHQQPD